MIPYRTLTLAAAALALTACGETKSGGRTAGLCLAFPAENAAAPSDPAAAVDDCLHRWGYSLAKSSDSADIVAGAVVAACSSSIAKWNQQGLNAGQGADPIEAPSLLTGETTSPIAEHYSFSQNRALFYVTQARAGKCSAPPAADGAPKGLTIR